MISNNYAKLSFISLGLLFQRKKKPTPKKHNKYLNDDKVS